MQFIEDNVFGLRAAIHTLRRLDRTVQFRLFPMIHIGELWYYEDIHRRLGECDAIFLEGVRLRLAWAPAIIQETIHLARHLKLVSQRELRLSDLTALVIRADMPGDEFDGHWLELPRWFRAMTWVAAPAMLVWLCGFATRRAIGCGLTAEDQPAAWDRELSNGAFAQCEELLLDKRDVGLCRALRAFESNHADEAVTAAVLYGAAHMRAVSDLLIGRLGYRVVSAEWVDVFRY